MSEENQPTLFIKAGCPWCIEAKAYFASHHIHYQEVDVRQDSQAMATLRQISGQTLTPTWQYQDEVIADFSVEEFVEALKDNPQSHSYCQT